MYTFQQIYGSVIGTEACVGPLGSAVEGSGSQGGADRVHLQQVLAVAVADVGWRPPLHGALLMIQCGGGRDGTVVARGVSGNVTA